MKEVLDSAQISHFIHKGFVRIDHAFDAELAAAARRILWNDIDADADDPSTWTKPVVRLGMYTQAPFVEAANTPVLHRAFDQLAGAGRWLPCTSMGTFPVRFPSLQDPGDTGWHVDASFPGDDASNYFEWRINWRSKGRALLMLFLFSDVGELDAPTRIRTGSHIDVAGLLRPFEEQGLSFMELAGQLSALPAREEVLATGKAGTVYLCHPFVAHAAQPHHGTEPRFIAQPPLVSMGDFMRGDGLPLSPVETAIQMSLSLF